jgi:hypothetical protein
MPPNKPKGSTSLSLFSGKTKGNRPFEKRGSQYETMRNSNDGDKKNNNEDEQVLVNLSNKVSVQSGIASARRFLWGEDEEEDIIAQMGNSVNSLFGGNPRTSFGPDDKAINLMAPPVRSDNPRAGPPASAFSFFSSTRQISATTEFNDADEFLFESEEYLSKPNRFQPVIVFLRLLIALAIILALFFVIRGMILDTEDSKPVRLTKDDLQ